MLLTGCERRRRLAESRLLLVFTPGLTPGDPLAALESALPHVDVVQVRPKALGDRRRGAPARAAVTEARSAYEWCLHVIDLFRALEGEARPLLFVNDRVDVARALAADGVDGVHVGADDTPVHVARAVLGEAPLVGLSTHSLTEVAEALDAPVDLLGFGPVFETQTKGYGSPESADNAPRLVGPERAWVAAEAAHVPLFPIGGIDATNADRLDRVGRAAVGSAILGADDPGAAARTLRAQLEPDDERA